MSVRDSEIKTIKVIDLFDRNGITPYYAGTAARD